jgi:hypothetical protein
MVFIPFKVSLSLSLGGDPLTTQSLILYEPEAQAHHNTAILTLLD